MKIETVLSPALFYQIEHLEDKVVVVIDILRATSTITTILHHGAAAVIPAKEEAVAQEYKAKGYLSGGERSGETIPGFDFGNSPFHYKKELIHGKEIVLTTTNGTKCIEMAQNAFQVVIGSFLNLNKVVEHITFMNKDIVLFCAGWKEKINLEDSLFAGAIASYFTDDDLDDSTLLCLDSYKVTKDHLFDTLRKSNHFRRLASKGVIEDIEYCCMQNTINSVGILKDGKLILA